MIKFKCSQHIYKLIILIVLLYQIRQLGDFKLNNREFNLLWPSNQGLNIIDVVIILASNEK